MRLQSLTFIRNTRSFFTFAAVIAGTGLLSLVPMEPNVNASKASFPGDNGKIAFIESYSLLKSINADGSNEQILNSSAISPAWSPDGKKIAYMAYGGGGIYIAEADGSKPELVTSNGDDPAWSPDGEKIVFRGPGCILYVHDLTSGLNTPITTLDPEAQSECHTTPNWKPNGSQIVFTRMIYWKVAYVHYDLWMVNDNGTGMTQLTDVGVGELQADPGEDSDPKWSPDGTRIVFSRSTPSYGVYSISAGGGSPIWLAATGNVRPYPSWSPDGEKIAYVFYNRTPDPHTYEIHVMDDDGSNDLMIISRTSKIWELDWGIYVGREFVVNKEGWWRDDDDPGDGYCDTGIDLPNGDPECSFNAALQEANAHPGRDKITFNIPGVSIPSYRWARWNGYAIEIDQPVEIDATTQPGGGRIEIHSHLDEYGQTECEHGADPTDCWSGILISGGDTTLRGLVVHGYTEWAIVITGKGGNVLEGNYIGVDPTGMISKGNGAILIQDGEDITWDGGGILIESSGNRIGGLDHPAGTCSGSCNLISGNTLVEGHYQGVPTGIAIRGVSAENNIISGNFIGTNLTGQQLPSGKVQYVGIALDNGGLIGNQVVGNVISGNEIAIDINGGGDHIIRDNLIGIAANGIGEISGSQKLGIFISDSNENQVENNVISDLVYGIWMVGNASNNNVIRENRIGTTADGAIGLGNTFGIQIEGSYSGDSPTNTQVISNTIAYNDYGVRLLFETTQNTIRGNSVHDNELGVWVYDSSNHEISENTIFDNQLGVWVERSSLGEQAKEVRISANSIYGNQNLTRSGLGIDLAPEGSTANDLSDADEGSNDLLNYPVLGFAVISGEDNLRIGGSYDSLVGSHNYRLEFFANLACDESGFGEGKDFLGYANVTTDFDGRTVVDFNLTQAGVSPGQFVTATAIDDDGNTSEFSRCVEARTGDGLSTAASLGSTRLQVYNTQAFIPGDLILINPGGENEEGNLVTGFGSLLLFSPLQYAHAAGEPVVIVSTRSYLPMVLK